MIAETERLLIREFEPADAPFIIELLNTPSWIKNIGQRNIHTIAAAEDYLTTGPLKSYTEYGYGAWLVADKSDEKPIGMCGLFKRSFLPVPDLGYAILPAYEGKGLTTEAVKAVISYSSKTYHINRFLAFTLPENPASVKLLDKCGFIYIGPFKSPISGDDLSLYQLDI